MVDAVNLELLKTLITDYILSTVVIIFSVAFLSFTVKKLMQLIMRFV